ncbi:MAG: phytanoyl-CoA dioxygenase family protein [Planctomycetes bacterium]|nr:phytanoyl-CoA dioxygenase family protein [Planctomycetota bacterium]
MSVATAPMQLTEQQLVQYQRDGYVVVEGLLSRDEVAGLLERVREYTHGGRDASKLHVQVEPRVKRGELKVAHLGDGVRKIDRLVQHDDRFRRLGLNENIVSILEQILGPDIQLFRNALMLKPPEVGSQKGMHQDSPYWKVEPMDLCSCWFALDDATPENGCMGVIPGGHLKGALPHVHVTDDFVIDEKHYNKDEMVLAPVKAGGGLFFHSLVPHYTAPNRSKHWRRAIALSYMSARSRSTQNPEPTYMTVKGRSFPGCVKGEAPPRL